MKIKAYARSNRRFYLIAALLSILFCLACQYTVWEIGQVVHEENVEGLSYSIRYYEELLPERIEETKRKLEAGEDEDASRELQRDLDELEEAKEHIEGMKEGREWTLALAEPYNKDSVWYLHFFSEMWVPKAVVATYQERWADNLSMEMSRSMYQYTFYFLLAVLLLFQLALGAIRGKETQEFIEQLPITRKDRFLYEYMAGFLYPVAGWLLAFYASAIFYAAQGVRIGELQCATLYAIFYAGLFYTMVFVIKDFFSLPVWGVAAGVILCALGAEYFNEDIAKTIVLGQADMRGKNLTYSIPVALLLWALILVVGVYRAKQIRYPRNAFIEGRGFCICVSLFVGRTVAAIFDKDDPMLHYRVPISVRGIFTWDASKYVIFVAASIAAGLLLYYLCRERKPRDGKASP